MPLQRTRSRALLGRSPLNGGSLGGRKRQLGILAILAGLPGLTSCVLALPGYNEPFQEKVLVVASSPAAFQIHIDGTDTPPVQVPADGRAIVHIPVLPRQCSTYLLGIKLKDRSVEAREVIQFVRGGRVVDRISVDYLRRQRSDSLGFHEIVLK